MADGPGDRDPIVVHWYAPELTAGDDHVLRSADVIEQALPWASLRFTVTDQGRPTPLADRDQAILSAAARGEAPLINNEDEQRPVTFGAVRVPASGRIPHHLKATLWLPRHHDVEHAAPELVADVGLALRAWWGHGSPMHTAAGIGQQIDVGFTVPGRPPPGLPALAMPQNLDGPLTPHLLGWLNYWSSEAARHIGFTGDPEWARAVAFVRPVDSAGWLVQLTEERLDLSVPSHVEVLRTVYDRLPAIGGRGSSASVNANEGSGVHGGGGARGQSGTGR
jgi:hypothetical protein